MPHKTKPSYDEAIKALRKIDAHREKADAIDAHVHAQEQEICRILRHQAEKGRAHQAMIAEHEQAACARLTTITALREANARLTETIEAWEREAVTA